MPDDFVAWGKGWLELNPSWSMEEWTDSRMPELSDDAAEMLRHCCHLSQKSNILRYSIIEQMGGFYLDTDMEPLRPIGDILDGVEAFTCTSYMGKTGCAAFGAVPHHSWSQELRSRVVEKDPKRSLSLGSMYMSDITAGHPEVRVFGNEVFYPYGPKDAVVMGKRRDFGPKTIAVHRWSSAWRPWGFERTEFHGHNEAIKKRFYEMKQKS